MSAALPGMITSQKIVVVDDNPASLYATSRILRSANFEVIEAKTGAEALAAATQDVGLIVLDINLPDMRGYDVLEALAAPETADIPVIVHSIDDDRQRALAAGACQHLVKPANRDVLAAAALRFARAPATGPAEPAVNTVAKKTA